MIRSKVFEKQARELALVRLKASPRLWRIFQKQKPAWWYWLLIGIALILSPLGIFIIFVALPFSAGMGVIDRGQWQPGMGCLVAGIALAAATGHAAWLIQELLCSRSLAIVSHLPLSDEQFLRQRIRRLAWALVIFSIVVLSFFGGVITGLGQFWTTRTLAVLGLAGVEWLIVSTLTFIIAAYFPRVASPNAIAKFAGWGGLTFAAGIIARNVINLEKVMNLALVLVPTGWPLVMLQFGVLNGERHVWWLLIGVIALIGLTWASVIRLRNKYSVAEVSFTEGTFAIAVLKQEFLEEAEAAEELFTQDLLEEPEDDDAVDEPALGAEIPLIRRIVNWLTLANEEREAVEVSADEAREVIRSRDFLQRNEWERAGWIERASNRVFDEREHFLVELLTGGKPRWSYRLSVICVQVLAGLLILYVLSLTFGRGLFAICGHLALAAITGIMRGAWPGAVWRNKTGNVCSITGLLPVSVKELGRLSMVLGVARVTVLMPMILGMALLAIWGITGKWNLSNGGMYALKTGLILIAMHQWWPVAFLPTSSTRAWWHIIIDIAGIVVLALSWLGCLVGLFVAGDSELWSLAAAAGLLGCGWILQAWAQYQILKMPFDFVTILRTDQQARAQQIQKILPDRTW